MVKLRRRSSAAVAVATAAFVGIAWSTNKGAGPRRFRAIGCR